MSEVAVEYRASPATLTVLPAPNADWDSFVVESGQASIYLRSGWTLLAREAFGHAVFFIEARDSAGKLQGVLPLVQQRSLMGNFITSIPFFNYGGALARSSEIELALMDRARSLAQERGCSYLELRDVALKTPDWRVRTDKVTMVLQLPPTSEALSKQLGSKLRSQIKRADREPVAVRTGGIELLDAFYDVFACNMRDLGTPVYPKRFFRAILQRFPEATKLVVIEHGGRAGAAGFLVLDGKRAEIPWASCRAESKSIGLNMKLYWEVLSTVIAQGCTSFDFGRSSVDSGTFKFKKQWGAQPIQLHWHRWERAPKSDVNDEAGNGKLMEYASSVWKRLPVPVANFLGPMISAGLPW